MKVYQSDEKPDVSRAVAVLICITTAMVCLAYDHVRSALPDWWRSCGGGIPYVVFWITFWFMVFPFRRSVVRISIFVTTFDQMLQYLIRHYGKPGMTTWPGGIGSPAPR